MASTIWKGQLSFGLVNIPVRLQRAGRKERIPLHYVSEVPHSRVEHPRVEDDNAVPGEHVPASSRKSDANAVRTKAALQGVPTGGMNPN
jgi:DNA end-binding protein Ku